MELFAELDIDNFNEEAILESITEAFSKPKVYISFKYTKKRKVIFYHLQVKVAKTTKDLLQGTAVKDSDGSQTFFIGEFSKNTEIEIKFGIIGLNIKYNEDSKNHIISHSIRNFYFRIICASSFRQHF